MIKRLFSSQLRINMVSGVATTIVNTMVLAVAYPLYLHFLGYEQYGVWLVLSIVLTFAQFGNLGISQAVMKLVAEEYGRGDIRAIQQYVATALTLLCLSGAVVLMGLLFLKRPIVAAFRLTDTNAQMVSWLLPYVGGLSVYVLAAEVFQGTLSGLGRMDWANGIRSLGGILKLVIGGPLLAAGFGVQSLLIAAIASRLMMHAAGVLCIRRIIPLRIVRAGNLNAHRGRCLLRFGGSVFAGSLVNLLFTPFNKLILSRYVGLDALPVYEIAFTGSMQVRGLLDSGFRALMPEISRIGAEMTSEARTRISQVYRRSMKLIFALGVPLHAALAILAAVLLRLWLGDKFVETLPGAFRVMLLGTFMSLLGVPAYYMLLGVGRVRHTLAAHAIQASVNLLLVLGVVLVSDVTVGAVVWACSSAMAAATLYLTLQAKCMNRRIHEERCKSETIGNDPEAVVV